MSPDYEFQEYLNNVPDCPNNVEPRDGVGYRFVHADKDHANNFRPPYVIRPKRRLPEDDTAKCSCYALSMYESEQLAIASYREILKRFKLFAKEAGDCLASIDLKPHHGHATKADGRGHFDFHPLRECGLPEATTWIGPTNATT